ncbi:pollen-specific leucine-rich repeat extensin-like protein 1 [Salvia divinorum]|uniref:Pollen-specific leucine-rich repeat extensin-like protein 1 n=1 Tax=Salvia divinorum TaxID=28513 RepID=A0ABD1GUJ6_SALDI
MEADGADLTPFWVQSTTKLRRSDRLRRSIAAVFFSSGLVVTAVFFLAFVVGSTISFSATIFRPNSIKKSWDSLNISLVLVAVVFGILSRNRNERSSSFDEFQTSPVKGNES